MVAGWPGEEAVLSYLLSPQEGCLRVGVNLIVNVLLCVSEAQPCMFQISQFPDALEVWYLKSKWDFR